MKGRALARNGYEQELSSIRAFIAMQNKADPGSASSSAESVSGKRSHDINNITCTVCIYNY